MTQPTEYVIGFCAGITTLMYVYRQVHTMIRENRNGNGHRVNGVQFGQLTPEDVEGRFSKLLHVCVESIMADMRNLMEARTGTLVKEVTNPIVGEIRGLRDDLSKWQRREP